MPTHDTLTRQQTAVGGGPPAKEPPLDAAQRWVLALASVGSFLVVLDMMVVATALTEIQRDLDASLESLEWTVNAYTLSFAGLLMTTASLGDRFGRRRVFALGLGLFAAASAGCALAPNVGALVAARTVQGVGAAAVMPLALALLNAAFPPRRRGWALGVYGGVTGAAVLFGPVLGGVVTEGLAWPWIFWLNVPVAAVALPLVLTRVSEGFGRSASVDPLGLGLFTLAAFGVVWALVRANAAGWGSAEVAGPLAGGAVLGAAFVAWQARARAPMLPLRLFRARAFSAGNATIFLLNAALAGAVFFVAQFFQVTMGEDALGAGLRLLPWGVAPLLLTPLSGRLTDRVGERPLTVLGMALQTVGLGWFALVCGAGAGYAAQVAPMTLVGVGAALAIPAVTKAVVSAGSPADVGTASGAYSTMRQLGGAFGVAVAAAVFASAGSHASPEGLRDGFTPALAACTALAGAGLVTAWVLPGRGRRPPVSRP